MPLHRKKKIYESAHLRMAMLGILVGIFLVSTGTLFVYFLDGIEWTGFRLRAGDIFLGLVIMFIVAVLEELLFRAFILRRLMRLTNRWIALIASAVLFALVHFSNMDITLLGLLNVFLGGLLFGVSFMLTRSLSFIISLHFAWNFLQGPVLGFPVSGLPFESLLIMERSKNSIINGGLFGFEGSVICTIILLLAFAGGFFLYIKKPKNIPIF